VNTYLQRYLGIDNERGAGRPSRFPSLRTLEKDYISFLLDITAQNRAEVSRILAISRSTLYHKISRYGIGEDGEDEPAS
jgi:DNA-binding NtrC family response regulator